jgi:hypothetical protein
MIVVSTFEVLFKRLFPDPGNQVNFDRRVVQGYFLSLTNLEDKAYTYAIEFHISEPDAALPNPERRRPNGGNCVVFFDTAGENQATSVVSYATTGGGVYGPGGGVPGSAGFSTFRIPARSTGLVLFFPDPFTFPGFTTTNPQVEVRGHVKLRLPALRRNRFFYQAQSTQPVRVLLNPETRATFFPDAAAGVTFSQTHSLLHTASGAAENALDPDPSFFVFDFFDDLGAVLPDRIPFVAGKRFLPDAIKVSGMLEMLRGDDKKDPRELLRSLVPESANDRGKGGKKK